MYFSRTLQNATRNDDRQKFTKRYEKASKLENPNETHIEAEYLSLNWQLQINADGICWPVAGFFPTSLDENRSTSGKGFDSRI